MNKPTIICNRIIRMRVLSDAVVGGPYINLVCLTPGRLLPLGKNRLLFAA